SRWKNSGPGRPVLHFSASIISLKSLLLPAVVCGYLFQAARLSCRGDCARDRVLLPRWSCESLRVSVLQGLLPVRSSLRDQLKCLSLNSLQRFRSRGRAQSELAARQPRRRLRAASGVLPCCAIRGCCLATDNSVRP